MAKQLSPMDLKQIITLHQDGFSNRKVADILGLNRNTINEYMTRFKACSRSLTELQQMDKKGLEALFPARSTIDNNRFNTLMKFFEKMNESVQHPGFTFQYHYREYKLHYNQPYSYTQFMEHYHRRYTKVKGSMKLAHQAGHEVFIDFAGKKLQIVDQETGEIKPVEVFVAILPHSHYTYVEACMSQQRKDLIKCMGHAFSFFGGVPRAIVSDNLKSAVNRASKYEADINRSFKEFAHHYDCVVNPARAYSPQDKALVENAVHLSYQRIYYPIREMTFFSLQELNREIRKGLEKYNDQLLQRKGISRKELFQSVERSYLKPLPDSEYQLKDYRRAKVQKIGYIYFSVDKTYYSVPYRYIGKQVQIHYTDSLVEIYYNHNRITSHERNPLKGTYITNEDHLSSTHRAYSQWSPEYFKKRAGKHGDAVLRFISGLLQENEYPEVNYKRAMGVIQLAKHYGSERLNKACDRALYGKSYSYRMVKNILKNSLENQQLDLFEIETSKPHIPKHENIRGASSYK